MSVADAIVNDGFLLDAFFGSCTCHFGPVVGLVDAMRVGPDVKELWADGPNREVGSRGLLDALGRYLA